MMTRPGPPKRLTLTLLFALLLPAFGPLSALAQSADARVFADTGYTINDDAVWAFFSEHGGTATFGPPISRELTFMGLPTQLFEAAALQVQPDGSVKPMQLSDPGLLPYTHFDGLTVPSASEALAMVAPSPDQPDYADRLEEFLHATVPDAWNGQPVHFLSTFAGVDVWGLPISRPAADPNNPNFVYQRFQNGILMYDATSGSTAPLPLGSYLRALLTQQNVPTDLGSEAANSPLAHPEALTDTDLTAAFVPDAS